MWQFGGLFKFGGLVKHLFFIQKYNLKESDILIENLQNELDDIHLLFESTRDDVLKYKKSVDVSFWNSSTFLQIFIIKALSQKGP